MVRDSVSKTPVQLLLLQLTSDFFFEMGKREGNYSVIRQSLE